MQCFRQPLVRGFCFEGREGRWGLPYLGGGRGESERLCVGAGGVEKLVGGADIVGGEEGEEGDTGGGFFDAGAAALLAIDEAEDAGDEHAGFAGGFDGGDGGAAGGADVVDDDDGGAGLGEAFDAAGGAVVFFGFADEEAVEERGGFGGVGGEVELGGEVEDFGVVGGSPSAAGGDVGDKGVGAHGEAADRDGLGDVLADEVVEEEAGEAAALGVEGGGAAVDVEVGFLARGKGEVAEAKGVGGQDLEEGGAGIGGRVGFGGHVGAILAEGGRGEIGMG